MHSFIDARCVNLFLEVLYLKRCQPNVLHRVGLQANPHVWTLGPHTIRMESVSDHLSRHVHICGLLEVILQSSGSFPIVPSNTIAEVAVLLLGCCPPMASSMPPDVLVCLLIAPPCSGHYSDRQ